ncbi:MAG: hypothetical protein QXT76_02720 [Sulfolobales archaeon]
MLTLVDACRNTCKYPIRSDVEITRGRRMLLRVFSELFKLIQLWKFRGVPEPDEVPSRMLERREWGHHSL